MLNNYLSFQNLVNWYASIVFVDYIIDTSIHVKIKCKNTMYKQTRHHRNQYHNMYIIIRDCTRVGAFPRAFCVPNSVALASLTLQVVYWAIH